MMYLLLQISVRSSAKPKESNALIDVAIASFKPVGLTFSGEQCPDWIKSGVHEFGWMKWVRMSW